MHIAHAVDMDEECHEENRRQHYGHKIVGQNAYVNIHSHESEPYDSRVLRPPGIVDPDSTEEYRQAHQERGENSQYRNPVTLSG